LLYKATTMLEVHTIAA